MTLPENLAEPTLNSVTDNGYATDRLDVPTTNALCSLQAELRLVSRCVVTVLVDVLEVA